MDLDRSPSFDALDLNTLYITVQSLSLSFPPGAVLLFANCGGRPRPCALGPALGPELLCLRIPVARLAGPVCVVLLGGPDVLAVAVLGLLVG